MRIAVLAAGGHTGKLVVDVLRARGADVTPLTRKEADARDREAVRAAIAGHDAMINLAGPFSQNGLAPVEAAIDARVPYVDTTGEQSFMLDVREKLHRGAIEAGVPVVNAMAFEYALGDLAARAHLPNGGDALHVLYRSSGARASAGTKKSVLRVLGAPTLSYENGNLTRVAVARYQRSFATQDGVRSGVSFAGGEILTVPRHTPFRTVRTYVATKHPMRARLLAPIARLALHGPILRAAESYVDARHRAPTNERARGEVHLVAEPSGEHVIVSTPDPYLATAHIAAEGALRLAGASKGGVLAPAEAFDARSLLEAIAKSLPGFGVGPMSAASRGRV